MLITKTVIIKQNDVELEFGIKKPTAYKLLMLVNQLLNALHVTPEVLTMGKNANVDALMSMRQLIHNMLKTGVEIETNDVGDVQLNTPLLDFIIENALTNPDEVIVSQLQLSLVQCLFYNEKNIKFDDLISLIKNPIELWNLFVTITKHCLEEFFIKKQ